MQPGHGDDEKSLLLLSVCAMIAFAAGTRLIVSLRGAKRSGTEDSTWPILSTMTKSLML
jgi:hypothetical protein